jgi:crotonobetainyl-CoA:carnitine CoA-transferase CaiB-like acyl-CoA transferase
MSTLDTPTLTPTTPPASRALSRYTVLDLSRVRAGPTASRQLADWGADVITIEPPSALESDGPQVGPRMGSDFRNLNRNKRAITLDLKQPEGVALLKRLAVEADVVLENFRPDVKHRLGIDYETLSAINPRLVYASISGFGQSGPYRTRPGFDQIAQGMGGIMSLTGTPEQGPLRTGIAIGDLSAGIFCAYGILLALIERETSGRGQWVQTSLVEALAFMLDFQAAQWLMDGTVPPRTAMITRPWRRPGRSGRRTASSTSPSSARRCGSASAPRWSSRIGWPMAISARTRAGSPIARG